MKRIAVKGNGTSDFPGVFRNSEKNPLSSSSLRTKPSRVTCFHATMAGEDDGVEMDQPAAVHRAWTFLNKRLSAKPRVNAGAAS